MIQTVEPCPVEAAIQVIDGKWKLLVSRSLALNGPQRYNELLTTVAGISQKELTRNLRELTGALLLAPGSGGSRIARSVRVNSRTWSTVTVPTCTAQPFMSAKRTCATAYKSPNMNFRMSTGPCDLSRLLPPCVQAMVIAHAVGGQA